MFHPVLCAIVLLVTGWPGLWASASSGEMTSETKMKAAVVAHHAALAHAQYADTLMLARRMQQAVEAFLKQPSPDSLLMTRQAWLAARVPYGQTEVCRFYDGPIEAVEGFVNAWPLDENHVDYTEFEPEAGIINLPVMFPSITRSSLIELNEKEGEKNISTGWHAIEFLLWGQDLYEDGPGRRSHEDYVQAPDARRRHATRRAEYLRVITSLLLEHLETLTWQWAPDQLGNYCSRLLAMPVDEALANIFKGVGSLSGAELGGERMLVAYTTKEQEDEHSCFSDNTHLDLLMNQAGIQNVCLGRYTRVDGGELKGPGICDLLDIVNPMLAATLRKQLDASTAAIRAIPAPFDTAIQGRDTAPGRVAVKRAITAVEAQTVTIAKAAAALGIRLNL